MNLRGILHLNPNIKHMVLYLICCMFPIIFVYQIIKANGNYFKFTDIASSSLRVNALRGKTLNYFKKNMSHRYKQCFQLSWNISEHNLELSDLAKSQCKRFVTATKSGGRTGNNMFRMAAVLGVAYRYDLIPIVPMDNMLLKYFDLPNVVNTSKFEIENNIKCSAAFPGIYVNFERTFSLLSNFTLDGPFQSWKYFENEMDIIRTVLRFKSYRVRKVRDYIEKVNTRGYIQVCIHVRRGDFTSSKNSKIGFSVANTLFIERAKRIFLKQYPHVLFIVVTNDKPWCKQNIKNVTISTFVDPGDDLALMASSDHAIITSGTFGWWGAWLSGGQIVYFKGYPRPDSYLDTKFIRYDYYPPSWIGLY